MRANIHRFIFCSYSAYLTENDEGKNKCKDVIKNFISSYFNFFPRVCSFFSILDFYWDFISIGARHKNRALSFIAFTTSVGLHGCCLFRPMNIIEQWKANLVSFGWTKWLFFKLIDWALLFYNAHLVDRIQRH